MAQTEKAAQEGLQTLIQAMPEFLNASVTINDWSVLDGSAQASPFVIIENSDDFDARQQTVSPETDWYIPCWLVVTFTDWKPTLDILRDMRQALIGMLNTDANRALSIPEGMIMNRIRSAIPITPMYDPYQENPEESLPLFLYQRFVFEITFF